MKKKHENSESDEKATKQIPFIYPYNMAMPMPFIDPQFHHMMMQQMTK